MQLTSRHAGRGMGPGIKMLLAGWAAALPGAGSAVASPSVELSLGSIQGPGWHVDEPRAVLDFENGDAVLRVTLPAVMADDRLLAGDVTLTCRGVAVNEAYLVCPDGRASLTVPPGERPLETSMSFVLRRADGHWRAEGQAALGSGLAWEARSGASGLSATLVAEAVPLTELDPWLPRLSESVASLSGTLTDVNLTLALPADGPLEVSGSLQGEGLGFDTASGTVAAAGVTGNAGFQWQARPDGWAGRVEAQVRGGEVLAGSFYTRLSDSPLRVSMDLVASDDAWRLDGVEVDQAGALSMSGTALWDWQSEQGLKELDARIAEVRFPGFYRDYLQPILAQYGFGELTTEGSASGRVRVGDGGLELLEVSFEHMDVSDSRGRLELTDLDGDLRWGAEGDPRPSRITWQGGRVYRIGLGSADIRAEAVADSFRLTRETVLPVLDGALVINAFRVGDWFGEEPELLFDARLMPISLDQLSEALDWPELQGTLAGRLPELTFQEGVYRLGGSLAVEVFDGSVRVENLRMERPFGVLPKLVADIRFDELDLERLTGTFTIGRITGLITGYVNNLRLLEWQPVHFDARLATPADSDVKQRISQRAVDTLSSLGGGGAGGAMSRTFLRVFDDFGYRRLGIECVLRNNVCDMGGVAPAPGGGYYLVEGSGLPRVDVIGYVRRVDWPVLVEQLIKSMQGQTPTVGQ